MFRLDRLIVVGMLLLACAAAPAAAETRPVVGLKVFAGPPGEGWGTAEPKELYLGGVPSGRLENLRWRSWGGPKAIGWGRTWIYRPRGGYYDRPVKVQVRVFDLGKCDGHRAYRHLLTRHPSRPGGDLGPWHSWTRPGRSLCDSRL